MTARQPKRSVGADHLGEGQERRLRRSLGGEALELRMYDDGGDRLAGPGGAGGDAFDKGRELRRAGDGDPPVLGEERRHRGAPLGRQIVRSKTTSALAAILVVGVGHDSCR